jgi:hypothetical protein
MPKIDFTRAITPEMIEARRTDKRRIEIRDECGRRIRAVLDDVTQLNVQGAALSGALSDADMAAFRAAKTWISDMRDACRSAIQTGSEPDWPDLPAAAEALAKRF